jgi:hypothetical protein
MSDDQDARARTPSLLTTVRDGPEADLICARLRDAGIEAVAQGGMYGARAALGGTREVYVEANDLERARATLQASEGISEDELAKAAEEAGSAIPPADQ